MKTKIGLIIGICIGLVLFTVYQIGFSAGRLHESEQRLKESCIENYFNKVGVSQWCLKYIEELP